MLLGLPLVCGRAAQTLFDDCKVVKPSVVFAVPNVLYALRAQTNHGLLKRRSWYVALFRAAFATRLRLQDFARDTWLMRLMFRHTQSLFGGQLRTLVVPTIESLPFAVRDFAAVCITPRIREVAFTHDCGIVVVNGVPPPSTLVRLVDLHQTAAAASGGLASAGEITISGPAVLPDAQGAAGWAHTSIISRWVGSTLNPICPRDGLLYPMLDVLVAAPMLEREYLAHTRLVANLFITCRPMRPLVAIVVPRRDAIDELSQQRGQVGVGQLPWADFVRVGRPLLLEEIERVARVANMPFAHIVRAVHLHPHPFLQHTSFFSQHLSIRRNRVARYFSAAIDQLYADLGRRHSTFAASAAGLDGSSSALQQPWTPSASPLAAGGGRDAPPGAAGPLVATSPATLYGVDGRAGAATPPLLSPHGASTVSPGAAMSSSVGRRRAAGSQSHRASRGFVLEPSAPFALDIGGSMAKVAYFQPPRHQIALPSYCEDEPSPEDMRTLFRANVTKFFGPQAAAAAAGAESASMGSPCASAITLAGDDHTGGDEGPGSEVGALRFMRLPTNRVTDFMNAMRQQHATRIFDAGCLTQIPATGGGAHKFAVGAKETLDNVTLAPVKEMESIIRGMQLCVESAQDCIFTYDWRELAPTPHRLAMSPSAGIYPFCVVNIGSGVSVVKCVAPDVPYVRIGGTPIGGGTFWGLAKSLTNVRTWDDVKELTRVDGPGDHTNVDLLVGDIYGFNAHDLPSRLTVDTVASCFGKLGTTRPNPGEPGGLHSDDYDDLGGGSGSRVGSGASTPVMGSAHGPAFPSSPAANGPDASQGAGAAGAAGSAPHGLDGANPPVRTRGVQPVDIIRSLLLMVAANVTQIAHLLCQAENVENIFFTGGFVRDNEVVWRHISRMLDYWSNSRRAAHFIESDGFLGVMGALAASSRPVPVRPEVAAAAGTSSAASGTSSKRPAAGASSSGGSSKDAAGGRTDGTAAPAAAETLAQHNSSSSSGDEAGSLAASTGSRPPLEGTPAQPRPTPLLRPVASPAGTAGSSNNSDQPRHRGPRPANSTYNAATSGGKSAELSPVSTTSTAGPVSPRFS